MHVDMYNGCKMVVFCCQIASLFYAVLQHQWGPSVQAVSESFRRYLVLHTDRSSVVLVSVSPLTTVIGRWKCSRMTAEIMTNTVIAIAAEMPTFLILVEFSKFYSYCKYFCFSTLYLCLSHSLSAVSDLQLRGICTLQNCQFAWYLCPRFVFHKWIQLDNNFSFFTTLHNYYCI